MLPIAGCDSVTIDSTSDIKSLPNLNPVFRDQFNSLLSRPGDFPANDLLYLDLDPEVISAATSQVQSAQFHQLLISKYYHVGIS